MRERNRKRGVVLLLALGALAALAVSLAAGAHRVSAAAAAAGHAQAAGQSHATPDAVALARALFHYARGEVVPGGAYLVDAGQPGAPLWYRLDCDAPAAGVELACVPAAPDDLTSLPVLPEVAR